MKEKFLYFAAMAMYQVAQCFFEAAQKEHLKKWPGHASQATKLRRFHEDQLN